MKPTDLPIQKQELLSFLQKFLQEELEEKRAEKKPQEEIIEIERALLMYRFLPVREFSEHDVIAPGSLTELELNGRKMWILLVPQHGGLVTQFNGKPVQVLTPSSPLGEALLGKKTDDRVEVPSASGVRSYRVIRIS